MKKDLKYETKQYVYNFEQFEAIRSSGNNIYTGKSNTLEEEN